MPPKVRFGREAVLHAALELVRSRGIDALNARAVASVLGCSTQPLFREFRSMEEIRGAVIQAAQRRYNEMIARSLSSPDRQYLASGLAYIQFAREEPELFKLLFMCDREAELSFREDANAEQILQTVMNATGLDRAQAERFHLQMWVFVHGLATMVATKFVVLDETQAEQMVRDAFFSMRLLMRRGDTTADGVD